MINFISSKDNEKLKYTRSLLKAKNRNSEKKYLIEGFRILSLALEHNKELDYIFINEDFEGKSEHRDLIDAFEKKGIDIYKTTNKNFKDLVDTENTQGIIGVKGFEENKIEDILDKTDFVVVLDRVQDPGNMGTIIRTADAAGVGAILVLKGSVDIYNPKVIRSTMGSIFSMNIVQVEEAKAIENLKQKEFSIASSYLDTTNQYDKADYGSKVALVIGNEANGICDSIISNSDILVKIPMYGSAESLNAAISSAILMYEIKKNLV